MLKNFLFLILIITIFLHGSAAEEFLALDVNDNKFRYSGVSFTHCGTGSQCGGNQKCQNLELALSDAFIWRSLGIPLPQGGVSTCPTSYFNSDQDCCNWETCPSYLRNQCPSCPLDGETTKYKVCVHSPATGKRVEAFVTGCCPSTHPCNKCKNVYNYPGGCSAEKDQADLCDNLWAALGYPSQDTTLEIWSC
jgi:hypothetical protein